MGAYGFLLKVMPDEQVNPDEMANDIVQGLLKFRELFDQGTPEEKKELSVPLLRSWS